MVKQSVVLGILLVTGRVQAQEPMTLKQAGWVGALAFSPDSRTLAIGTSDGRVSRWQVSSGDMISKVAAHRDAVAALAFSKDGKLLVSGGHDRATILRRLERKDGKQPEKADLAVHGHKGAVLSVALTPDGKRLFTGSIDGTIREWDIGQERFNKVSLVEDHTSWVNGLAIDHAGTLLASASS